MAKSYGELTPEEIDRIVNDPNFEAIMQEAQNRMENMQRAADRKLVGMEDVELKPCPFCGAAASPPSKRKLGVGKANRPLWEVECTQFCVSMCRGSRKDVVSGWNKRIGEK